ncbi:MAG TPA: hypothetical protein EYQ50_01175 [Verrucomicrobiales bacterium]|nr:hypothetical protein [Verrucomicrobiales bacterium]
MQSRGTDGLTYWESEDQFHRALVYSICLHIFLMLFAEFGSRLGWWKATVLPKAARTELANQQPTPPTKSQPNIFVRVHSDSESLPPEDTPYYSDQNSTASDASEEDSSQSPEIDGSQETILETRDSPMISSSDNSQSDPSEKESATDEQIAITEHPPLLKETEAEFESLNPTSPTTPDTISESGELLVPTPVEDSRPLEALNLLTSGSDQPATPRKKFRPRLLSQVPGYAEQKIRQKGGTEKWSIEAGLDVMQTPFGSYDRAMIEAIRQHWFDLLIERDFTHQRTGRVVIEFKLHYTGKITDLDISENKVGPLLGLLCQMAVRNPSPFPKWPKNLTMIHGRNYRNIRFTFHYN